MRRAKPSLEARAPQSAQRNINLQDLRPLEIPNVSVGIQKRFVDLWDAHYELRECRYRQIRKLRQVKQAIASDFLQGVHQLTESTCMNVWSENTPSLPTVGL